MLRRIVLPEGTLHEGEITLPDDVAVHVRDVLRLHVGDSITVTDGAGQRAEASLLEIGKRVVRARAGAIEAIPRPESMSLSIYQCVAKGEKMDSVVRQATELGASELVPVASKRSVARLESRIDRWRAIAEDALRVSGRAFRPRIEGVTPLAQILSRARAPLALCCAGGVEESLAARLDRAGDREKTRAEVLIGPEGGLDEEELRAAETAGFSLVHLGASTLRTETAGPAVIAILLYWAGSIAR